VNAGTSQFAARQAKRSRSGPACPHRPPCSGCPRFGEPGIAPAVRDALDALARVHGLPPVRVISGTSVGFRLRARLAIRGRIDSPKIGLFELGSHRLVHIPNCSVQHPLINKVADVVRRALVDARISCYSEKAHLGLARYLQVAVERRSQTAQVVVVGNSATMEPFAACFELIRERLGSELHSLWFNANQTTTNTILGADFTRYCGPASVIERFGGAEIHYPPGAFGQSNLEIAEEIVACVRGQVPHGARVTEFYAGVGAIGLSLLPAVSELRMNEISPQSLAGLELGMARLDAEDRAKVSVVPGPAGHAAAAVAGADVVIVDPPRKGLDAALTDALRERPPARLIYVSCALRSFVDDSARLTATAGLRLSSLTAFNLLPYTEHVETVACFERV